MTEQRSRSAPIVRAGRQLTFPGVGASKAGPRSASGRAPRNSVARILLSNPCEYCPRKGATPVRPVPFPEKCLLVAVGLAPGGHEEDSGCLFVGEAGQLLRRGLRQAGLDPETQVGYVNLGRCRPANDDFESAEWQKAEDCCWHHLTADLRGWTGPLLLLGTRPVMRFFDDKKARVTAKRGLWYELPQWHQVFAANHPSGVLRSGSAAKEQQFLSDLGRAARRVLKTERFPPVKVHVFKSPVEARGFLARLPDRWFFDIESEDALAVPGQAGRKHVGTDPFHPDFRLRGVAIAVGPGEGAWVECKAMAGQRAKARTILDAAFMSDAEKGAFFGGFDEDCLVYGGWVTAIRNRTMDPYLASLALDATFSLGGHSLERLVVEMLGEPQPKAGVDRGRIHDMDLRSVAEYAVNDACAEWRLHDALQRRLEHGEYF